MESEQEITPMPQDTDLSLAERVSLLEKRLEDALMLLTDTYRYGKLKELLEAGKFDEADLETTRVMIEIAGKPTMDDITPDDLKKFPCNALMVIDRLWQKYSNNRFGFSVQLRLYQSFGGNMDTIRAQENKYLRLVSESIGWRVDGEIVEREDFDFSLNAAEGALPGNWWNSPYGAKMANFFLARLIACEI